MRRVVLAVALFALAPSAFAQDCVDATAPADDCDRDGFAPSENDCDDEDAAINPDAVDVCGDSIDNNCNGDVDDACDLQSGELSGGSGCGAENGWAVLFLPILPVFLRRRRKT